MSSDWHVLVVDRAEGALQGVMEELDLLGFHAVWVPTLSAALMFIKASPKLSLVIASAAAAADGGPEFLVEVRNIRPSLRIICGTRRQSPGNPPHGPAPDSLLPEPFRSDALRGAVSVLLAEQFYPKAVADAIMAAALEVLGTLGEFRIEGGAFLVANQTALSDLSSIIAFSGDASGHLMVGMASEHARMLYQRLLVGARRAPAGHLEDMVGELCNQILGRINAFLAEHAFAIQQTTPIFIRSAGSTMRFPGRHPSFGVQLARGDARVSLEYYLAEFDGSKLASDTGTESLRMGEVRFF
jgi:CheY-specific phosphatase CheX